MNNDHAADRALHEQRVFAWAHFVSVAPLIKDHADAADWASLARRARRGWPPLVSHDYLRSSASAFLAALGMRFEKRRYVDVVLDEAVRGRP